MSKKKKIAVTVTNDFHNTEARLRVAEGDVLIRSRVRRLRSVLCGSSMCKCSGELGTRGHQEGFKSSGLDLEDNYDGTFNVISA